MFPGCARREPVGRLGVTPAKTVVALGGCAPLRFEWLPAAPLDRVHGKVFVFVHLLAEPGNPDGNLDHPLPEPWRPGHAQSYEIQACPSAFEPPLRPGTYRLTAGLYDESWGYRWPLEAGGGAQTDRREYVMGSVVVISATGAKP